MVTGGNGGVTTRPLALAAAALLALAACSTAALDGRYMAVDGGGPGTVLGHGLGFEFDGDTAYSLQGDDIVQGTYTIDGSNVRICIDGRCADFRLIDDCLAALAEPVNYCQ